jgi:hypothetical protein
VNVNVNVVKIVKSVMPNKKAKLKKQERRAKNDYLQKNGRTPSQIKRKKKRS